MTKLAINLITFFNHALKGDILWGNERQQIRYISIDIHTHVNVVNVTLTY